MKFFFFFLWEFIKGFSAIQIPILFCFFFFFSVVLFVLLYKRVSVRCIISSSPLLPPKKNRSRRDKSNCMLPILKLKIWQRFNMLKQYLCSHIFLSDVLILHSFFLWLITHFPFISERERNRNP